MQKVEECFDVGRGNTKFRIKFDGVITEFCRCYSFKTLATLREIRVALDPSETVHMNTSPTLELVLGVLRKSGFEEHINPMDLRARTKEGKIEEVAVERRHNRWLDILDMREEARNRGGLLNALVELMVTLTDARSPRQAR